MLREELTHTHTYTHVHIQTHTCFVVALQMLREEVETYGEIKQELAILADAFKVRAHVCVCEHMLTCVFVCGVVSCACPFAYWNSHSLPTHTHKTQRHTLTYTHNPINTYAHAHVHTLTYTCTHACTHNHIDTYTHTCAYTYVYTHTRLYTHHIDTYTHAYVHALAHTHTHTHTGERCRGY